MQQRDLLQDQIEQLGRTLGKLVAYLLQLQQTGDLHPGLQQARQETKDRTGIDLDALLGRPHADLLAYATAHDLTAGHLDQLADYLGRLARLAAPEERSTYLTTAIHLLEVADERSQTYSFSRVAAKTHLLALLR